MCFSLETADADNVLLLQLKVLAVAGENDIGGVRDLTKFKELFKAFEQVTIAFFHMPDLL